jgi:hypothetical protein
MRCVIPTRPKFSFPKTFAKKYHSNVAAQHKIAGFARSPFPVCLSATCGIGKAASSGALHV